MKIGVTETTSPADGVLYPGCHLPLHSVLGNKNTAVSILRSQAGGFVRLVSVFFFFFFGLLFKDPSVSCASGVCFAAPALLWPGGMGAGLQGQSAHVVVWMTHPLDQFAGSACFELFTCLFKRS